MNSNLVAFYYGNLTHPSVDPPRIGFLSMVPDNASSIVQSVVSQAQANGGIFGSMPIPYVTNSLSMTADPLNYHRHVTSCPNRFGKQRLTNTHQLLYSFGISVVFFFHNVGQIECFVVVWILK